MTARDANCRVRGRGRMPDLAGSTSKNKVIWPKRMSLSLITSRDMVVCQKTKKWNCGGIHRITQRVLWVFKFFIRYYGEFTFWSCSIDAPILSYGQIFSCVRFGCRPAISYTTVFVSSKNDWKNVEVYRDFHYIMVTISSIISLQNYQKRCPKA
jgi:hypothetical protein